MERTEIIKALECCSDPTLWCDDCPYDKKSLGCKNALIADALALIKEQQEELTYCYDKLTELEKECLGLSLHNITLKREKKYLEDRLKEEMEIKEDMESLQTAVGHSDPVGERGECGLKHICMTDTVNKMKEKVYEVAQCLDEVDAFFLKEMIDQIAKEVLEGEQNDHRTIN